MDAMVDSCVLLDVFTEDRLWFSWSAAALARQADQGMLVINPVIYAEVSVRFQGIEELEEALPDAIFQYRPIPKEAAFLAGKCFLAYRRRGGHKLLPLPDFFIAAHAAVEQLPLITRDTERIEAFFPGVILIRPDATH